MSLSLAGRFLRTGIMVETCTALVRLNVQENFFTLFSPVSISGRRTYDGVRMSEAVRRAGPDAFWQRVTGLGETPPAPGVLELRRASRIAGFGRSTNEYSNVLTSPDSLRYICDMLEGVSPSWMTMLSGSYRMFRRRGWREYGLGDEDLTSFFIVQGIMAHIAALCERYGRGGVVEFGESRQMEEGVVLKKVALRSGAVNELHARTLCDRIMVSCGREAGGQNTERMAAKMSASEILRVYECLCGHCFFISNAYWWVV